MREPSLMARSSFPRGDCPGVGGGWSGQAISACPGELERDEWVADSRVPECPDQEHPCGLWAALFGQVGGTLPRQSGARRARQTAHSHFRSLNNKYFNSN